MNPHHAVAWIKAHLSGHPFFTWIGTGVLAATANLAETLWVRNVIAIGALLAALAVIWTRLIKPAVEWSRMPDRIDKLETGQGQLSGDIKANGDRIEELAAQIATATITLHDISATIENHLVDRVRPATDRDDNPGVTF